MRSIAWAALGAGLAGVIALGYTAGAVAHGMGYGAYSYRPKRVYYYRAVKPRAPRARRYYYRSPRPAARPGSCGQFKYWSKGRCLDARTKPPDLK